MASTSHEHGHATEGPYTWEDFIALEEDDLRELIDGELVEVEVPTFDHERIVALLVMLIGTWARERSAGIVIASGYKVRITNKRGVMPDVQFFRTGNVPPESMNAGLSEGRPDLAIEILSKSSRGYDRIKKLNWYASIGVPEYWVVDPRERSLERMILREDGYLITDALGKGGVLRPDTLEGLVIEIELLWRAKQG
jgi:Uma2 family endonuclease